MFENVWEIEQPVDDSLRHEWIGHDLALFAGALILGGNQDATPYLETDIGLPSR